MLPQPPPGGNHLFWPPAGRKETFILFVLAALPPKRTKKTILSLLPQAEKP
jgi:hypothetical protein